MVLEPDCNGTIRSSLSATTTEHYYKLHPVQVLIHSSEMKFTSAFLVALASAKKPRSWGDDENAEACIYDEVDGVTTITTVEQLIEKTKCYKKFSCDGGRNVMAKVNEMYLGSFGVSDQFCNENFVKFEYRVPREGDTDYPIEDKFCDKSHPLELGEWRTMDDHVWFSFEFTNWDYYDWFYGYNDYMGNEVGSNPKFEIEFKCSEPVEPEPTTTAPETADATTNAATTLDATTNAPTPPNYAQGRIDDARNSWEEMISRSTMSDKAKTRTLNKYNRICDKLQARHEKLSAAGCSYQAANFFNGFFVDYDDTCTTKDKLIQGKISVLVTKYISFWHQMKNVTQNSLDFAGEKYKKISTFFLDLKYWGRDFIVDCEMDSEPPKNISKFWNRISNRLDKFKDNMDRFAKCD